MPLLLFFTKHLPTKYRRDFQSVLRLATAATKTMSREHFLAEKSNFKGHISISSPLLEDRGTLLRGLNPPLILVTRDIFVTAISFVFAVAVTAIENTAIFIFTLQHCA